jgi:hypothetical protein
MSSLAINMSNGDLVIGVKVIAFNGRPFNSDKTEM